MVLRFIDLDLSKLLGLVNNPGITEVKTMQQLSKIPRKSYNQGIPKPSKLQICCLLKVCIISWFPNLKRQKLKKQNTFQRTYTKLLFSLFYMTIEGEGEEASCGAKPQPGQCTKKHILCHGREALLSLTLKVCSMSSCISQVLYISISFAFVPLYIICPLNIFFNFIFQDNPMHSSNPSI